MRIAAWLLGELGFVTALGLVTGITASAWLLDALRFEPHIGPLITSAGAKLDLRAVGLVAAITGLAALVVWVLLLRVQRRDDVWSTIKEGRSEGAGLITHISGASRMVEAPFPTTHPHPVSYSALVAQAAWGRLHRIGEEATRPRKIAVVLQPRERALAYIDQSRHQLLNESRQRTEYDL